MSNTMYIVHTTDASGNIVYVSSASISKSYIYSNDVKESVSSSIDNVSLTKDFSWAKIFDSEESAKLVSNFVKGSIDIYTFLKNIPEQEVTA